MARQRPTTRHFHNQPELRRGDSSSLMLRWIFLVWLASYGPLGNTVKQDEENFLNFTCYTRVKEIFVACSLLQPTSQTSTIIVKVLSPKLRLSAAPWVKMNTNQKNKVAPGLSAWT
ncbi:unnamed protein product [Leptosia nina]|uniref:Uncharacterized protein n=1 Tax=Leptosia nina TaxID=320188 RepID=A0AAV1JXU7_9NEOP